MQRTLLHSLLLILMMTAFGGCRDAAPRLPDLRERYGPTDTRPFGAYTAYRIISNSYPQQPLNLVKKPFSKFYSGTYLKAPALYINISNKYYTSDEDAQSLLDFVYEGHTAFIAASEIDTSLLSLIYGRQQSSDLLGLFMPQKYSRTSVSLLPDDYSQQDTFGYFYRPFTGHFTEIHGDRGRITGYNNFEQPNFMVFFWGKGKLFLHSEPRALSNYFLLTQNNHLYLKQILQMMEEKPTKVFYDNHYNKKSFRDSGDSKSFSAIDEILKHPALAAAFWLSIALLLVYIVFGGKRKQRIVPVIEPVNNTSIAFTEAVAGLYLSERDNKNIAEKMISHFSEHLRSRYFLNLHAPHKDFVFALSKKSGVDAEQVQLLYNSMEQVSQAEAVSDFELLALNEQIQNFYKKRN